MGRVLVVDGDARTRANYARALRRAGHEVTVASTGNRAVHELGVDDYDVVLTESLLGDKTILDLLDWMNARTLRVPVVVVTAWASIEVAVEVMRRGAWNYALKPRPNSWLIQQVEQVLKACGDVQPEPAVAIHGHSSARLVNAVVGLADTREDVRTIGQWARTIGVSGSVLRTWCRLAGVLPRRALTFTRLVRAVYQSQDRPWRPEQRLDISDRRTLRRVLSDGGLADGPSTVNLGRWLQVQSLVTDPEALTALQASLTGPDRRSKPY